MFESADPVHADGMIESLKHLLRGWGRQLEACPACHADLAPDSGFCRYCRRLFPRQTARCLRCAIPLAAGETCGECQHHPPPFSRSFVALDYDFPIDALLQAAKYSRNQPVMRALAEEFAQAAIHWPTPAQLFAMPLHPRRERERGFNQAEILKREWQKLSGQALPATSCRLQRIIDTPPQSTRTRAARQRNVRNAFAFTGQLSGTVTLIDDVMTTGATAGAASKALLAAGADEVHVWLLARPHY